MRPAAPWGMRPLAGALLALLMTVPTAHGEENVYPHVALYWLDWVGAELAFATEAAGGGKPPVYAESAELLLVKKELASIRQEMAALRATMDEYLGGVIASMQQENAALRRDLEHAQRGSPQPATAPLFPAVPRPEGEHAPFPTLPAPVSPEPAGPPSYEVVKEWGRTPEVAATLGPGITALKGMVIVIPPGTPSAAIEELGRTLRDQFDAYDNINIEVFDDADAAARYMEHPTPRPPHNVLSVSREAETGRDTILITENGITMDVPR